MAKVKIVQTVPSHIAELKTSIREQDKSEILKLGISVERGLWRSYRKSIYCQTGLIDGKVAAIWGICGGALSGTNTIWLITSEEVKKISPLRFARIYQEQVYALLEIYHNLENYVDSEYTAAKRLLEIIGFTIYPPEPYGYGNAMFNKFSIRKA